MRHLVLFALILAFTAGCSKKQPPAPPEPAPAPAPGEPPKKDPPAPDTTAKDRAYWLTALKGTNPKAKEEAALELAAWVETDAESIAALLELLKDRSTTGAGKILPTRINSTREAAAVALAHGGPKGEAALKSKGLATLKEGLTDQDAAVREHTAYTLGLLGPLARPLSADVMKLCTDPNAEVRGRAFDALRDVGVTDPVGLVALLQNERRDVVGLAAELVAALQDVPAAAVPGLTAALASQDATVRTAAASALATAGPKAAPAVEALVKAVNESYPKMFDEAKPFQVGAEEAYWRALEAAGGPAVAPTAGLLSHTNPVVRMFAAHTLGRIGPPAKPAAEKLRTALRDKVGEVGIEAACALCLIGEAKTEVLQLMKQVLDANGPPAALVIEALPRIGAAGKELVPAAVAKLTSTNVAVRFAAVGLVGTLAPAEASRHADALGKLATDPEQLVRRRVGMVLEKLGPAAVPAAEALGKAIPEEKDEGIRDQLVDAVVAMGPGAKPALPALLARAREATPQVERRARLFAAVVAADPASKDVADLLVRELGNPEPAVRVAAAAAVAKLDPMPTAALNRLVEQANTDKATQARVAALRALAAAGPKAKPVRAEVERLAGGRLPEFALLAKVAVAAMDGNVGKAAADVRAGLTDRNSQVRAAAAGSLGAVGPAASDLPALLRLLKDVGGPTREAAAVCVGRLGAAAKEAVPQLVRLLDDREGEVRAAAAAALGEMGPAAMPAVEKLKQLRGDGRFGDPQAGPAARKALEKLGVQEKR